LVGLDVQLLGVSSFGWFFNACITQQLPKDIDIAPRINRRKSNPQ
jgi:hypothetical protein